jgi:hypothetical protein
MSDISGDVLKKDVECEKTENRGACAEFRSQGVKIFSEI